jgi:hypothetical protein
MGLGEVFRKLLPQETEQQRLQRLMSEARGRKWRRNTLDGQLRAITALGETESVEALSFLAKLYRPKISEGALLDTEDQGNGTGWYHVNTGYYKEHTYPQVRNPLRDALKIGARSENKLRYPQNPALDKEEYWETFNERKQENRGHQVIEGALQRLRVDTDRNFRHTRGDNTANM